MFGSETAKVEFEEECNEQAYAALKDGNQYKKYNNRLPKSVQRSEMGQKFFAKGWKFNQFNEQKQINKAIAAVVIIFAQFVFSVSSLIIQKSQTQCYSIVVLTYCSICMFSYFNVTYVRDFDALQVNFTPLMLTVCGLVSLAEGNYDFFLVGMVITLIADSYFALRFKDETDQIKFSVLERFAMENWSQDAFNKAGQVTFQVIAVTLIFTQLFLSIVGAQNKEAISFVFAVFYLVRLVQFLGLKTGLAMNMVQSNFVCLGLAVLGVFTLIGTASIFTKISCALLILDALLGAAIFTNHNQEDIYKELGVYKEYKRMEISKTLNCEGHTTNLIIGADDSRREEA